jgi:hypothetical protein
MNIVKEYHDENEFFSISDEIMGWAIYSDKMMNINVIALNTRLSKYRKRFPAIESIYIGGSYLGSKPYHMLTVRITVKPDLNLGDLIMALIHETKLTKEEFDQAEIWDKKHPRKYHCRSDSSFRSHEPDMSGVAYDTEPDWSGAFGR